MKIGKPKPPPTGLEDVPEATYAKPGDAEYVYRPQGGKPTKYKREYCQLLVDYFANARSWKSHLSDKGHMQIVPMSKLPTLRRFCGTLNIRSRTPYDWAKKYPEWKEAMAEAMEYQESFLVELVAAGVISNAGMSLLRIKHGYVEPKAEEAKEDGPIQKVVVEVVGANLNKGD